MEELDRKEFSELVRLVKENNRMLHKMRRSALWGGIFKFVFYLLVLVIAPLWIYSTYLAPIMSEMLDTYQQVQGTGAKVQAQFGDLKNLLEQFKIKSPSAQQ